MVRIAFQGFENDRIFSEGLIGRRTITTRGHWDALCRNGTPECLGTPVPLTAIKGSLSGVDLVPRSVASPTKPLLAWLRHSTNCA